MGRYTIGIDLGTTNSALAFVDTLIDAKAELFAISQFVDVGVLEDKVAFPSCCYVSTQAESRRTFYPFSDAPQKYALGAAAFKRLLDSPARVIQSAKSWLSFPEVDRTAKILPWGNTDIPEAEKLSPIDVSSYYLSYLKETWNASFAKNNPDYAFEKQDIVITVPASFDETAQRLTLEAAYQAGFPENTRLLEEPQAAFYHYLQLHDLSNFEGTVLVCDTGGGTTDFSLFYVKQTGTPLPEITRLSVSNHLLLGGDNIDLTVAHILATRLTDKKLSYQERAQLVFQSRLLKEKLLNSSGSKDDEFTVSIAGSGASLFASAMSATIKRGELEEIILNGFFPECELKAELESRPQGLQEFGLRYATDSAVTRHLANFISSLDNQKIDAVLFNGGTLKPEFLQDRILNIITKWQGGYSPQKLENSEMDFAVSLGAAHYGATLHKKAGKIRGGYPRSVYLEFDTADGNKLLCVIPKGFDEGERAAITTHKFKLIVGRPARFSLFNSLIRKNDKLGDIVDLNTHDFLPVLPTMQTVVNGSDDLVSIESELTETGLLQLYCINEAGERVSKLEFNLKGESAVVSQKAEAIDEKKLKVAEEIIARYFGKADKNETAKPKGLVKELEKAISLEKDEWSLPFLRALWPALEKGMTKKNRSVQHEAAWLNLAGFVLRPGYGAELDSFRMTELWRLFELGLAFPKDAVVQVQWALLWRRVAGGLNREQQTKIATEFFKQLGNSDNPELYWLLASLERIPEEQRIKIGNALVRKIQRTKGQFIQPFALLAAREPLYGEVNCAVPAKYVATWFDTLGALDWKAVQYQNLCYAFLQAGRLTNDPSRDLDETYREKIAAKISSVKRDSEFTKPLKEFIKTELQDKQTLMGEVLPLGFTLC